MAKKVTKKKKPPKQKIDVVLESLLNLERRMKELISHVEQLRYSQSRFKDIECVELKMSEEQKENFKKLYLETITKDWIYSRLIVGLDEMGLPIFMDSWHHKHDIKFTQEQVDDTIIPKMEVGKELVKRTKNLNENIESIMGSKFDDFKKRLSEIVNEDYIESWLQKPNASFNNRKPIDLINEDNYEPLYSMIYKLGSGEPSS